MCILTPKYMLFIILRIKSCIAIANSMVLTKRRSFSGFAMIRGCQNRSKLLYSRSCRTQSGNREGVFYYNLHNFLYYLRCGKHSQSLCLQMVRRWWKRQLAWNRILNRTKEEKSPVVAPTGDFVLVFTITYINSFQLHYNICTKLNQVFPG